MCKKEDELLTFFTHQKLNEQCFLIIVSHVVPKELRVSMNHITFGLKHIWFGTAQITIIHKVINVLPPDICFGTKVIPVGMKHIRFVTIVITFVTKHT